MVTLEQLQSKKESICIIGLGYVGLPLAQLLAKNFSIIGFDINETRISELKDGFDRSGELSKEELLSVRIEYTIDPSVISKAKFVIVTLPSPIDSNNSPDLSIIKAGSKTIGKHITPGTIVVYESTVYPGVTEEMCAPIIEKESGLSCGKDFYIGYSPERIVPGDKVHTIDKVVKVVSAMNDDSLDVVAGVYGAMTTVHKAPTIRVAEAEKVIENVQRDLNIALVNELAELCSKMDISVYDVLEAAGTKWNFIKYAPGLVGGHCIGVDPYYLAYKAEEVGHHAQLILAARRINDEMPHFISRLLIKEMIKKGRDISKSQFVIYGITFKANVRDIRNSKVVDLYNDLKELGVDPIIYDPFADPEEVKKEYGIDLCIKGECPKADMLIVAVEHQEFLDMSAQQYVEHLSPNGLLFDLKHVLDKKEFIDNGIDYFSL